MKMVSIYDYKIDYLDNDDCHYKLVKSIRYCVITVLIFIGFLIYWYFTSNSRIDCTECIEFVHIPMIPFYLLILVNSFTIFNLIKSTTNYFISCFTKKDKNHPLLSLIIKIVHIIFFLCICGGLIYLIKYLESSI